jgi:hypothetical protein
MVSVVLLNFPYILVLNGLLTSQYGDMKKEMLIFGELKPVGSFLKHGRLGLVAFVLTAYPIFMLPCLPTA